MFAVLAFCIVLITFIVVSGTDTEAAKTAVDSAFWCITLVLSAYVFGATWEDINRMKRIGRRSRRRSLYDDYERGGYYEESGDW